MNPQAPSAIPLKPSAPPPAAPFSGPVAKRAATWFLRRLSELTPFTWALIAARWIQRDTSFQFAWIYYATPWALVSGLTLGAASFCYLVRRPRLTLIQSVACLTSFTAWFATSFHFSLPPSQLPANSVRVVFWNANRPGSELKKPADFIRPFNADLIALAESSVKYSFYINPWLKELPGYTGRQVSKDLILFAKGSIEVLDRGSLANHGHWGIARVQLRGEPWHVLFIDISPSLHRHRSRPFGVLRDVLKSISHDRLLVVGDFNTPSDSVFFEPLREELQDTFEAAGLGFDATWHRRLPVLSLDHIWASRDISVIHTVHAATRLSDHKAVITDLVAKLPPAGSQKKVEPPRAPVR